MLIKRFLTRRLIAYVFVGCALAPMSASAQVLTREAQIAQLQALVASLTAQLMLLLQQRGLASGSGATPVVSGKVVITRVLAVGSRGSDVSALQTFLRSTGHYTYPEITGYYGLVTAQAVAAYQRANGLEAVGSVGPLTRALIATQSAASAGSGGTIGGSTQPWTPRPTPSPIIYGGGSSGGGGGGGGGGGSSSTSSGGGGGGTTTTTDTTTPTVPTNLSGTASATWVDLSWTASSDDVGVTGYRVYRDDVQIATTPTASYQDTGLSPATVYTYTVAAYDAAGSVSATSSSYAAITLGAGTPMSAVGDRVLTTANVNVRQSASITAPIVGIATVGSVGTIVGGPTTASGQTWWQINFDTGADGWCLGTYLNEIATDSTFGTSGSPAMRTAMASAR